MKRSEGERVRARAVLDRLRACIKGVELALDDESAPVGNEAGQAVTQTAIELAVLLAKLDAYQRAEQDQRSMVQIPTERNREALAPKHMMCSCLAADLDTSDPLNCSRCGKLLPAEKREALLAYQKTLCSYCGHPRNSTTCQQSHA